MPLFRSAVSQLRSTPEPSSSLENPAMPLTSTELIDWLGAGHRTDAGIDVTPIGSLSMGPVWRAVALISGLGGALPMHVYRRGSYERLPSLLLDDPHPELTPVELWRLSYVHRLLWGNSYAQKVYNGAGQLTYLFPIRPERVRTGRVAPSADNPSGKVFEVRADDGGTEAMTSREVFHIPGLGYDGVCGVSPIRVARQAIALGLAAEKYGARLFGSGSLMSGILQTEQRLKQDQAEALQERWRRKVAGVHRSHDVAVLDSGAKFQPLTMPNDDAQFIESRRFSVTDVSRFFGVPPFLLGETEKSTSWGTGLEQQATGFIKFDLHPQWLAPTEQRITKELLLPRDRYAQYVLEGLLRGDSAQRSAFYRVMRDVGAFSANDIRALENRGPIDGGDTYLQPMNMEPVGAGDGTDDGGDGDDGDSAADDD